MTPRGITKNLLIVFLFSCLISLLSACGFHLQGEMKLAQPLHKMYLDVPDPYGYLALSLKQNLRVSHVDLVSTRNEADTILVIMRDDNSQTLKSVSATQQTQQYDLVVTVVFEILNNKGVTLLPAQTLRDTRTITMQSNQILGSSNEANLYYQQMRRSLALAIIDRLASHEVTRILTEPNVTHTKKS